MNKVFLSHGSKDKELYIRTIAERLGKENIEYDEWTFEEGEKNSDEIEAKIDACDLFAIFLSDYALSRGWVQREMERAGKMLDIKIKKIYPIIIDPSITYADPRIPEWMRDQYNLKFIGRPVVAARRIQSKLRELHWTEHPEKKLRQTIFVGRNELLREFESRIDDIDLPKPSCIFASGIQRIGRSSLLRNALAKSNLSKSSYIPIKISLDRLDSIEDVILKLFDTGLTSIETEKITDMLNKSMSEKISLLNTVLRDIQSTKEIIFIEDNGCFVGHKREIAEWLISALSGLQPSPVLCVSTKYRIDRSQLRPYKNLYAIEVPELSPSERSGLFKRLVELHNIDINSDDFNYFANQLHGFPEEAYFCTDLILDHGMEKAKKASHEITEFNSERASILLRNFEQNQKALDFIYFLSEFEFIGLSFIFEIVDESEFQPILDEIVTHSICDYIGNEQEYVRLNDTIRDLIKRNRLELPDLYKDKLSQHVKRFVKNTNIFERDISDFFYSIKESLAHGDKIDQKFLVPSHILRTIRDLYYKRENLRRVVTLADMLLAKESSLDPKVAEDVRYYLCLALARQKDRRVLSEAFKINGPEHDFILGFYYRLCGRHADAIERLTKILDTHYISARAKRELVQVYLYIEEFDKAMSMARENYETNRGNQFPIQSYLNCLINAENPAEHKEEINRLIGELDQIGSMQSREMSLIAKGLVAAKIEINKTEAYNHISDAIGLNPDALYPYLAKFDIALRFHDSETMLECLTKLEQLANTKTFSNNTIIKNKAYYLAAQNKIEEARNLIRTGLENYPQETLDKLMIKLENIRQT